jgi:hypothetical protein
MHGITKIVTGVTAKILDFMFSGYGLVCDAMLLKTIFQHLHYRYIVCRNLMANARLVSLCRQIRSHTINKMTELVRPEEDRKWYARER